MHRSLLFLIFLNLVFGACKTRRNKRLEGKKIEDSSAKGYCTSAKRRIIDTSKISLSAEDFRVLPQLSRVEDLGLPTVPHIIIENFQDDTNLYVFEIKKQDGTLIKNGRGVIAVSLSDLSKVSRAVPYIPQDGMKYILELRGCVEKRSSLAEEEPYVLNIEKTKIELNCSKVVKKEFTLAKQELKSQRDRRAYDNYRIIYDNMSKLIVSNYKSCLKASKGAKDTLFSTVNTEPLNCLQLSKHIADSYEGAQDFAIVKQAPAPPGQSCKLPLLTVSKSQLKILEKTALLSPEKSSSTLSSPPSLPSPPTVYPSVSLTYKGQDPWSYLLSAPDFPQDTVYQLLVRQLRSSDVSLNHTAQSSSLYSDIILSKAPLFLEAASISKKESLKAKLEICWQSLKAPGTCVDQATAVSKDFLLKRPSSPTAATTVSSTKEAGSDHQVVSNIGYAAGAVSTLVAGIVIRRMNLLHREKKRIEDDFKSLRRASTEDIKRLSVKLESANSDLLKLQKDLEDLQKEKAQLVEEKDAEIKQARTREKEVLSKLDEAEMSHQRFSQQLNEARQAAENQNAQNAQNLATERQAKERAQQALEQLQTEHIDALSKVQSLEAEKSELRQREAAVRRELDEARHRTEDLDRRLKLANRLKSEEEIKNKALQLDLVKEQAALASEQGDRLLAEQKVSALQQELQSTQRRFAEQLAEQREAIKSLESEKEAQRSALHAAIENKVALQAQLQSAEESLNLYTEESERQVQGLRADLEAARRGQAAAELEKSRLALQLERAKAELKQLTDDKQASEGEREAAQGRVTQLSGELESAREESQRLVAENQGLRRQLAEQTAQFAQEEQLSTEKEAAKRVAELQVANLTSQLAGVQSEVRSIREKLEESTSNEARLTADLALEQAARQKDRDEAQGNLSRSLSELEDLKTKETKAELRADKLAEQLALSRLQNQELSSQIGSSKGEAKSLRAELAHASNKLASLESKLKSSGSAKQKAKEELGEARIEVKTLTKKIAQVEGNQRSLEQQLGEKTAENKRLQGEKKRADKGVSQLNTKLFSAREENERLVAQSQREIAEATARIGAAEARAGALEEEVRGLRASNVEMEADQLVQASALRNVNQRLAEAIDSEDARQREVFMLREDQLGKPQVLARRAPAPQQQSPRQRAASPKGSGIIREYEMQELRRAQGVDAPEGHRQPWNPNFPYAHSPAFPQILGRRGLRLVSDLSSEEKNISQAMLMINRAKYQNELLALEVYEKMTNKEVERELLKRLD